MVYFILKKILAIAARVYFKRIQVFGQENIPEQGPVLLACNHPSAFMEGCLVAGFTKRPLHFIVRGDVFQLKWLKPLLKRTNQVPIFRFRDGFSKLRENKSAFDTIYSVLASGAAVIIYPEGSTSLIKQRRPLQKGLAKIAFGAMEKYDGMPLKVIPIGINYSEILKFRSDVSIVMGPPMEVEPYFEKYQEDNLNAIAELTAEVKRRLDPFVLHLDDPDRSWTEPLLRTAAALYGERRVLFTRSSLTFEAENCMAEAINALSDDRSSEIAEEIRAMKLPPRFESSLFSTTPKWWAAIMIIVLAIPAVLGYFLNLVPFEFGRRLARSKVKEMEFYAPLFMAAWSLSHALILIILVLVLLSAGCGWWSLLPVLFPLTGIFSVVWYDHWNIFKTIDSVKPHEARLREVAIELLDSNKK